MTAVQFAFSYDDQGVTLRLSEPERPGLIRQLFGGRRAGNRRLPGEDRELAFALADLRAQAREDDPGLEIAEETVRLSHELVSRIDARTADRLGLPPLVDLVFETEVDGLLGTPSFTLRYRWCRGDRTASVSRTGAILSTDRGERRIPHAILQAIEIAESFDARSDLVDHWAALARFRQSLDPEAMEEPERPDFAARTRMTEFLRNLRIFSSDAMSISPFKTAEGLDFDPVPFSRRKLARLEPGSEVQEADAVLSGSELQRFQQEVRSRGARPAYLIGENAYLTIDRAAAPALQVIAAKQGAPAAERDAFARNPRPAIAEAMEAALRAAGDLDGLTAQEIEAAVEAAAEPAFVETAEFSSRVVGIGRWQPPELPLPPAPATTWLPEVFEEPLRSAIAGMDLEALRALRSAVQQAVAAGKPAVATDHGPVPANAASLSAIDTRISELQRQPGAAQPEPAGAPAEPAGPIILRTADNFLELAWKPDRGPRLTSEPVAIPAEVKTPLLTHQVASLEWAIAAWKAGLPGILNADEQGLGKTLQTIAFLAWLRRHMRNPEAEARGPILIVAPTSLLENWEAEVDTHMHAPGLGGIVRLYGPGIATRRRSGLQGRDIDDGKARLDLDWLEEKIRDGRGHEHWLLTTYTTLTNYQHSLARLPFSVAVFDEVQAVKNPASLRAEAVRAMNADFRIGLTGTPVENRSSDIWAIMDQIVPGALGSLRQFADTFAEGDEAAMRRLHAAIFRPTEGRPALGLRRLKAMVACDLPPKERFLHPRLMPEIQARRYEEARAKLASGNRGAALAMLHHIRSVSVHPGMDDELEADDTRFIAASARLSAAFDILRSIRARNERALVFIEHRRLQYRFAELARREFGLERVDIINGETPVQKRLGIVRRFQRHLKQDGGFDLLVLGPRAAGTGLTLTAATHVIHLSRWWNPAVEEQCNDRVHRIGQTRPVSIHVPLALHPRYRTQSFDCLLQDLMQRKRQLASTVLWPAGDTPDDAHALEEALTRSASEPPPAAALDDRALLRSLEGYRRFAPPRELAPGLYELPSAEAGRSILLATGEARDPLGALARAPAEVQARTATGIVLAQAPGTPPPAVPQLPYPVTILAGESLAAWPNYALVDG